MSPSRFLSRKTSILFFSRLAWALFAVSLVVSAFECGIEYASGRANIQQTALNILKGFFAVSLLSTLPVRLYELSVTLQGTFAAGLTGYGSSIGEVGKQILTELGEAETLGDVMSTTSLGLTVLTSPIMFLFCVILMAYAVIKVFFANLKRGGILLIQIAVGSLYMFSIPRGYSNTYQRVYDPEKKLSYNYIHGEADMDRSVETSNLVLGIDEYLDTDRKNIDLEFLPFKKYYQRIYKSTENAYLEWYDRIQADDADYYRKVKLSETGKPDPLCGFPGQKRYYLSASSIKRHEHTLYIFGHSLDITDRDVLQLLICNDNVQTKIYYHRKSEQDKAALGGIIRNLLCGSSEVQSADLCAGAKELPGGRAGDTGCCAGMDPITGLHL